MRSTNYMIFAILLFILILIPFTLAELTANIGNAKMIVRANVSDLVQKSILVKNINNDTVVINITAEGNNSKDITIIDNSFTLKPGEEKDAKFTINATTPGMYDDKIKVFFYSPSENKGVGLASNVILIVKDSCITIGNRKDAKFCNSNYTYEIQKEIDFNCTKSYECKTNNCKDNICTKYSLFEKILNFFLNLFK